jgi:plastocyanin
MSRRIVGLTTLGLLFAAAALPPAVLGGDPCFHSTSRPTPTTGSTLEISIADCVFQPTVSYVDVGARVEWRNASSQAHEIVGANLTWGAHEKLLATGDTIGWSFDAPGTYAYSCMIHPGMTGAIVVGDAAASSSDVGLASSVDPAAAEPGTTDTGPLPIAAAGGIGLLVGVLGSLVIARRRTTVD